MIATVIEDYLNDCRARGLSIKTIEDNYGFALKDVWLPWLERQGIADLSKVDSRTIMRWQADLLGLPGKRGKPVSRYSIEGWVKAINSFLRWAKAQGEIDHDAKGRAPRPPRTVMDPLTREEIDLMERRAQTERDKLIVRLLADSGIRASELLSLRTSDLIERDRQFFIKVHGKGNRERLVPVPRLGVRLNRFVRGQDGRIFLTLRRRPSGEVEPLTLSGLQKMIRSLGREAGIQKRVHPHGFRHAYATHALSRGMNLIQLADILGHSGLAMLQRNYVHLSSRDAWEAAARLFAD